MSFEDWKDKISEFKTVDVRQLQGNFFPGLLKMAKNTPEGEGIKIIQTFEPHPLYAALKAIGFEHYTEKVDSGDFHVYFYRIKKKDDIEQSPFRPLALLNFPMIDEELGEITANFWNLTWNDEKRTLPYETRLLLSLTNAVGAGRMRQASRELIKAYIYGVDSAILDDVFELLAWNQGIGYFSSEIGPSALFQAYKLIKTQEKNGKSRDEIKQMLMEKFGEKNIEVSVQ